MDFMPLDTLGIEPRASRMLSGCDTTTPCAHLLALADTDTMHLPTTEIPSWSPRSLYCQAFVAQQRQSGTHRTRRNMVL